MAAWYNQYHFYSHGYSCIGAGPACGGRGQAWLALSTLAGLVEGEGWPGWVRRRARCYRGGLALGALAGQAAEDAALRHLEAGGDGWDAGKRGGQAGHIGLHVAEQLLQLVQHWGGETERRRSARGGGRASAQPAPPALPPHPGRGARAQGSGGQGRGSTLRTDTAGNGRTGGGYSGVGGARDTREILT